MMGGRGFRVEELKSRTFVFQFLALVSTVDTVDSCSKTLIFCNTTQSHTAAGKEVDMSKATLAAGCKSYYWVSAAIAQSSNCGSFETSPPVTITSLSTIISS